MRLDVDIGQTDVLIIDDSVFIHFAMKDYFLKSGFRKVVCTNNGAEGLRLFQELKPRVVIIDAVMPEMDGFVVFSVMHNIDIEQKCVFVMVTSSQNEGDMERAFTIGFDDYFFKPVNMFLFVAKIKKMLWDKIRCIDEIEKDEIAKTRYVQTSMLPIWIDNAYVSVEHLYSPFEEVSGDFLEYLWDEKTRTLRGYIFDVAGHGLSSAMQVFAIKMLFSQGRNRFSTMMDYVNREMFRNNQHENMVAAISFEVDLRTNMLRFTAAGISPFKVLTNMGMTETIKTTGFPLGYDKNTRYRSRSFSLNGVKEIIFGSDGYFELLDRNLDMKTKEDDASAVIVKIKRGVCENGLDSRKK